MPRNTPLTTPAGPLPARGRKVTVKAAPKQGGPNPNIDIDPPLKHFMEFAGDRAVPVVAVFGRMNPPTAGHAAVLARAAELAEQSGGRVAVFLSPTQDQTRNPLSFEQRRALVAEAFGVEPRQSPGRNLLDVLVQLQAESDDVTLVVGSDRYDDAARVVEKYNGSDFQFDTLSVVGVGSRGSDESETDGVSATAMRAAVRLGDMDAFRAGLPESLADVAEEVFDRVARGLGMPVGEDMLSEILAERTTEDAAERIVEAIRRKADAAGGSFDVLCEVFCRGLADWQPGRLTPEQHAFNRVNSFVADGHARRMDSDLVEGFLKHLIHQGVHSILRGGLTTHLLGPKPKKARPRAPLLSAGASKKKTKHPPIQGGAPPPPPPPVQGGAPAPKKAAKAAPVQGGAPAAASPPPPPAAPAAAPKPIQAAAKAPPAPANGNAPSPAANSNHPGAPKPKPAAAKAPPAPANGNAPSHAAPKAIGNDNSPKPVNAAKPAARPAAAEPKPAEKPASTTPPPKDDHSDDFVKMDRAKFRELLKKHGKDLKKMTIDESSPIKPFSAF